MENVTTLTFFRYEGLRKLSGLKKMQYNLVSPPQLDGLVFLKFLGSGGGNGFSIWPRFSTYGLLCIWDTIEHAREFLKSGFFQQIDNKASESWTVFLQTTQSKGLWGGQNLFQPSGEISGHTSSIAVLTRATISYKHLIDFWRHVPKTSDHVEDYEGLLFSIGIGELPLVQQATFTLWESKEAMQQYAYKSASHRKVITRTRQKNWYTEEMFVRFAPITSEGSWLGSDPLEQFISGEGK